MNVTLRRISQTDLGTYGMLIAEDKTLCHTCEDPWENNARSVSCIPPGTYQVTKRFSPKYGQHWHVQNVPGRSLILIHNGNFTTDTEGCILVGDGFLRDRDNQIIGVANSKATMKYLRSTLPDAFTLVVEP